MSKRHRTGTYRRGCLLSVFDAAAVETWLEDLARRGERFTGSQGLWVLLEPDEPRVCRFRLQPLRRRKEAMDPERLAAYRTLGWTLAGQLQGVFWVWRCDDPAAPELDTDPVVQGEGYRYLRERMFRSRLVLLALLAAAVGLYLLHGFSMWTLLLGIVEDSLPGYLLCTALCVVLGAVQIGLDIRDLRRLWRTLTAGVPLERPRPYRLARALGAAAGALLVVFYGMFCINMVLTNGSGPHFARQAHRQGAPEPGVVYVDLRTLDGRDDVSYHIVRTKVHELCPRMYWVDQETPYEGEIRRPGASTAYYRLLAEGLAKELAEELRREPSRELRGRGPAEPCDAGALDGFWWAEDRYEDGGTTQYAVARLGREVLAVRYIGPTDLRTETDYLAALLSG